MKRDEPKAPTAIHGRLKFKISSSDKANKRAERVRPYDIQILIILLQLRKACRISWIPNVKVYHSFYD